MQKENWNFNSLLNYFVLYACSTIDRMQQQVMWPALYALKYRQQRNTALLIADVIDHKRF